MEASSREQKHLVLHQAIKNLENTADKFAGLLS